MAKHFNTKLLSTDNLTLVDHPVLIFTRVYGFCFKDLVQRPEKICHDNFIVFRSLFNKNRISLNIQLKVNKKNT